MLPVRRSTEKRYFDGLKRLFGGFLNRLRIGGKSPEEIALEAEETAQMVGGSERVQKLSMDMIQAARNETVLAWRRALLKNEKGPRMYRQLQNELKGPVGKRIMELTAENSSYIKTVPQNWAAYVTAYAQRAAAQGKRPEEIEEELQKIMPEHILRNLKCIARTEMAKANAAITEARAENLGIRAYIWHSAKDERTRKSHLAMDGVMVFYDDPPNPEAMFGGGKPYGSYHAGNTFNCRCYMEPVVNINQLPDEVRLHYHGKVAYWSKRMIRSRFGKIDG